MKAARKSKSKSLFKEHSLGIVSSMILILWIVLYSFSSSSTHLGSFFGNAIADWTGVVVTVFATKFMYERGSAESRQPPKELGSRFFERLRDHSLTIFLLVTGALWVVLYTFVDSENKWGEVVGNIVSEWTQIFGLVLMTKKLVETHSKESSR